MRPCICFILLWLASASGLRAQHTKPSPPWWVERFKVTAGMFFPVNNTSVKVGSPDGEFGTTIDFEDNLGFSKHTFTFLGDFQWRASRRSAWMVRLVCTAVSPVASAMCSWVSGNR